MCVIETIIVAQNTQHFVYLYFMYQNIIIMIFNDVNFLYIKKSLYKYCVKSNHVECLHENGRFFKKKGIINWIKNLF